MLEVKEDRGGLGDLVMTPEGQVDAARVSPS